MTRSRYYFGMFSRRRFIIEILAWVALYYVLLSAAIVALGGHLVSGLTLRTIVGILPMVAGIGILRLVMREHRKNDELQQKITSEAIIFAFGLTAVITLTYGFLQQSVAAPGISYFFVWPILAGGWVIGTVLAQRRYR